ncbi:MAG: methyltransferase family protein [Croceibacterium sp.]
MTWLEHRLPPPLVAATFALAMWALARWFPLLQVSFPGQGLSASMILMAGIAVITLAIGRFVRASTTVDPLHPEAASALVTAGIFGLTRNPMYLGMALVLSAWALWLGEGLSVLLLAGFVAYVTRFQIVPEERALRASFGRDFADYCGRVRRWI